MPPLPDNAHQATLYPTALENNPCCRSISDDDLCAWCSHLLYRPGELSPCSLNITEGHWPSHCDEDGYAQSCPSLLLNLPPNPINKRGKTNMTDIINLNNALPLQPQPADAGSAPALTATLVKDEQRVGF